MAQPVGRRACYGGGCERFVQQQQQPQSIQCPYCGSYRTVRERGQWEWVWLIAAAASLFMRLLLTLARSGQYRGEPGVYRCGTCGRSFTFFV